MVDRDGDETTRRARMEFWVSKKRIDALLEARDRLLKFQHRHGVFLERFRSLERAMEKEERLVTAEAKMFAEPGKTVTVFESDHVTVTVNEEKVKIRFT